MEKNLIIVYKKKTATVTWTSAYIYNSISYNTPMCYEKKVNWIRMMMKYVDLLGKFWTLNREQTSSSP